MYYGQIFLCDCANGIGNRLSLFVSGCTNHCPGCFQPETWDFHYGQEYTQQTEQFILEELAHSYYHGITILGGEPFEPSNQEEIVKLLRALRRELPTRTVWIYTGFTYDRDLVPGGCRYTDVTDEILDCTDILVDGRFVQEKRNLMLNFRGSENQRIIDMKQSRAQGCVVLSELNNDPKQRQRTGIAQ